MRAVDGIDDPAVGLIFTLSAFFPPETVLWIFPAQGFFQKGLDSDIGFGDQIPGAFFRDFQVLQVIKIIQSDRTRFPDHFFQHLE